MGVDMSASMWVRTKPATMSLVEISQTKCALPVSPKIAALQSADHLTRPTLILCAHIYSLLLESPRQTSRNLSQKILDYCDRLTHLSALVWFNPQRESFRRPRWGFFLYLIRGESILRLLHPAPLRVGIELALDLLIRFQLLLGNPDLGCQSASAVTALE